MNTPLTGNELALLAILGAPPMPNSRYSTSTHLRGALYAYCAPRLGMDKAMPDLGPIVQGVTRQNFTAQKPKVAARLRHAMRGKLALDADLSDILDLLDALEEGYAGEEMEEGQDRYHRGARDIDPNGFGSGGSGSAGVGSGGWATGRGEGPDSIYSNEPPDCTDPEQWQANHPRGLDQEQEYEPWRDADEEEMRRRQIAGSTGSQSLDDRIAMNRDRQRRAADNRKATIDRMRQLVKDALSARDTPVEGLNQGVTQSSALDPAAPEIDTRATGQDRRRVAGDSALSARGRMIQNMSRVGVNTGTAYCAAPVAGVPASGSGSSSDFQRRHPWASRIKIG
jgi:hypothetical protein